MLTLFGSRGDATDASRPRPLEVVCQMTDLRPM